VQIDPHTVNRVTKVWAVDTLQLRGMDRQRFMRKLGDVTPTIMEAIVLAIAASCSTEVVSRKPCITIASLRYSGPLRNAE
jgi:hypothetical protein